MELTKEQQDTLATWKEVVLGTINNEDSLLTLISQINHERQVYIAQNKSGNWPLTSLSSTQRPKSFLTSSRKS